MVGIEIRLWKGRQPGAVVFSRLSMNHEGEHMAFCEAQRVSIEHGHCSRALNQGATDGNLRTKSKFLNYLSLQSAFALVPISHHDLEYPSPTLAAATCAHTPTLPIVLTLFNFTSPTRRSAFGT